jgi:hypothetical protein
MLQKAGILERIGPRFWYVGRGRLRERLPEVYDDVVAGLAETRADNTTRVRARAEASG